MLATYMLYTPNSNLTKVVQKVDNALRWINPYPVHTAIGSPNIYTLDGDLSSGQCYPAIQQPEPWRLGLRALMVVRNNYVNITSLFLPLANEPKPY